MPQALPSQITSQMSAITPADGTIYDPPLCGLLVMGAGDLHILPAGGDHNGVATVIVITVPAGFRLDQQVSIVKTATTATEIYGFGPR